MPTKTPAKKAANKRATKEGSGTDADTRLGVNVAVVRGVVSSPPERRVLPSDTVLVQLQVTTRLEAETLSIPVACWNPDTRVEELEAGSEVVVVGRVRRRFFRAGGATASRVEVEADVVALASDKRRVRAATRRAAVALEALDE